jgi:hypothetical protein
MPATRSTSGRPCPEERRENAALRNHVRKTFEKAQQEEAFKELLNAMGANGGKVSYGAVSQIMKKYQSHGFKTVTRQNLYYQLQKIKKCDPGGSVVGKSVSITDNTAVLSDVTNPSFSSSTSSNEVAKENDDNCTSTTPITNEKSSKHGGRAKGSSAEAKSKAVILKEDVVTRCAILYNEEREKACKNKTNVPPGTLKAIVEKELEEAGLETTAISLDTIQSRVKRKNVTAENPHEAPLIAEVEPIICDF